MDEPLETVYEGKWLRLKKRGRWEFAERTNQGGMAVIIVAATPDGCLLFVEQHRVAIEGKTIEMPAGLVGDIDAGESLELAAERELLEETGWQAARLEVLMIGPTSSGMSNERVAFVRASGLTRVHAGGGDDSEDIIVHEVPVATAPAWLAQKMAEGYALDAKLWAGLWLLDRNPDGSAAR
jgi:ADP-ribose pyrophosphatase